MDKFKPEEYKKVKNIREIEEGVPEGFPEFNKHKGKITESLRQTEFLIKDFRNKGKLPEKILDLLEEEKELEKEQENIRREISLIDEEKAEGEEYARLDRLQKKFYNNQLKMTEVLNEINKISYEDEDVDKALQKFIDDKIEANKLTNPKNPELN